MRATYEVFLNHRPKNGIDRRAYGIEYHRYDRGYWQLVFMWHRWRYWITRRPQPQEAK